MFDDGLTATIATARQHGIGDLLRRTAGRTPNKTAIVCGDVSWTYAEFDALCERLARGLHGMGTAKGDRLAVLSRNSHSFAALRFAAAKIGIILVPINFMLNPDEIRFILPIPARERSRSGPISSKWPRRRRRRAARSKRSYGCRARKEHPRRRTC